MDSQKIFEKFQAVGRAALTVDLQNSHSGNMAQRWRDDSGLERIAITASGSQKGELTRDKVCSPALAETNFGYFKASSETDIHARILLVTGAQASMHCHTKTATVITMDDAPLPKPNPRPEFHAADPLGVRYLGPVPVDWFRIPSGSPEMTETVSTRLKDHLVTMIQNHGGMAKGESLEEAFFYLAVLEHAAEVVAAAELLGVDLAAERRRASALRPQLVAPLPAYTVVDDGRRDFADEPETEALFLTEGFRIFESRLSPFHTGTMSLRAASSLLYSPKASQPYDLAGPLLELPLARTSGENSLWSGPELDLHRAVYAETPLKALLHCYPSEAEATALAVKTEPGKWGRIIPIDSEGGFLYPAIPILPPSPSPEDLCRALLDYHVAIVAHGGVWAAGEQSISETLHHVSSIKDVCRYRLGALQRGLDLARLEPQRARTW